MLKLSVTKHFYIIGCVTGKIICRSFCRIRVIFVHTCRITLTWWPCIIFIIWFFRFNTNIDVVFSLTFIIRIIAQGTRRSQMSFMKTKTSYLFQIVLLCWGLLIFKHRHEGWLIELQKNTFSACFFSWFFWCQKGRTLWIYCHNYSQRVLYKNV